MDAGEAVELGLVLIILAVVAVTSLKTTYTRLYSGNTSLIAEDKNTSSIDGGVLQSYYDSKIELDEVIAAVIIVCDTDKSSPLYIRIVDGEAKVIDKTPIVKGDMTDMANSIRDRVAHYTNAGYQIAAYNTTMEFNRVFIDVYLK